MLKKLEWIARAIALVVFCFTMVPLAIGLLAYPPLAGAVLVASQLPFAFLDYSLVEFAVAASLVAAAFAIWVPILFWGLQQFETPRPVDRVLEWLFDLEPGSTAPHRT